MIKCKLCDFECEGGRSAHAHMNRVHHAEYLAVDCDLEKVTEGYTRKKAKTYSKAPGERKEEPMKKNESDRPKKLRLLNKLNADELEAYNSGHRYYDPETEFAYTTEECKEEGWI